MKAIVAFLVLACARFIVAATEKGFEAFDFFLVARHAGELLPGLHSRKAHVVRLDDAAFVAVAQFSKIGQNVCATFDVVARLVKVERLTKDGPESWYDLGGSDRAFVRDRGGAVGTFGRDDAGKQQVVNLVFVRGGGDPRGKLGSVLCGLWKFPGDLRGEPTDAIFLHLIGGKVRRVGGWGVYVGNKSRCHDRGGRL